MAPSGSGWGRCEKPSMYVLGSVDIFDGANKGAGEGEATQTHHLDFKLSVTFLIRKELQTMS